MKMMTARRVSGWALGLLLAAALAACAQAAPDKLADQTFLTDQPCAAPCWHGLELGSSTKGAALSLLPTLPFVDGASIKDQTITWQGDAAASKITFGCVHPPSSNCGNAIFTGDRLRWLEASVGYALTLKQVVAKIGAPTRLDYTLGLDSGCNVTGAWPTKNIGVVLNGLTGSVCENLRMGLGIPPDVK